jgi:DNA gyrase subunit A
VASTHEYVLFFTSKGKVYRLKVHELPLASRTAKGTAIVNLLPLEEGETVKAVIDTRDFPEDDYLMFATRSGMVKKTSMSEYSRSRRDGIIAINLRDGDELVAVRRVHAGDKVILVSDAGKAIKWDESQVRPMGRNTSGVKGITLTDGANLLGMEISNGKGDLFVITEKGYGKRTPVEEYPEQNRGGQGVYTIVMTQKKGLLAAVKVVAPQHELMIVSNDGVVIRVKVKDISELGRSTQGVRIMNVAEGDKVAALARMKANKPKAKVAEGQGLFDLDAVTEGLEEVDLGDGEDDTVDEDLDGVEVAEGAQE